MDYPGYLAARGIWTVGSARAGLCEPLAAGPGGPGAALERARERLAGLIRGHLPEREGALLNTLLIGWRGEMEPEDELAFTRTGTGHLLAVSGIHVMLLVGAVWWALRMMRVPARWAAVALLVFAAGYAELAGARAPVTRAALMAGLLLGGIALGRTADGLASLAAAWLVILALWPRELFSAGLQMSFAAVATIMTAVGPLENWWLARRGFRPEDLAAEKREVWRAKVAAWLRISVFCSLAATAGTLPLIADCFGLLSPWSALINILAIPVAGLALALGLVFVAVAAVAPPLAALPAALVWGALRVLELIVGAAERLPGCSLAADSPPGWALLGFYLLAAALLLPSERLGRWRVRAVAAVLALSVAAGVSGWLRPARTAAPRVTVLALARGQAAIFEDPAGGAAAVWAGGSGRELVDCLRAEGLGRLELAVVPADREALFSGGAYLVRSGRARRLALPVGDVVSAQVADLARLAPGAARMAPGWEHRLGTTGLLALGAEPFVHKDGSARARPLMVLARPQERGAEGPAAVPGVLFADLSSGPSVRAAAAALAGRSPAAGVLVCGFAWRPPKETPELVRAGGARVALLALSRFEAGEPAGRELLRLCRRGGLLALSTAECGSLRATLCAGRVRLEEHADGRWRPLGSVRLKAR
jgi:ComEC/Rec2-related protein